MNTQVMIVSINTPPQELGVVVAADAVFLLAPARLHAASQQRETERALQFPEHTGVHWQRRCLWLCVAAAATQLLALLLALLLLLGAVDAIERTRRKQCVQVCM